MATPQIHPGLVPIEEAARTLGTTVLNLLMHIKQDRLDGREIDGKWHVTEESLARFAAEPRKALTKPHCGKNCGGDCR